VQQVQQNYRLAVAGFSILLFFGAPILRVQAANRAQPDPLLTEAKGPCDPRLDGPNYVPGTDVDGNPVAPADVSQAKVPVPEAILLPLGTAANGSTTKAQALASLNRKELDSILNPPPACPPEPKAR
jgi:hypothetical protein